VPILFCGAVTFLVIVNVRRHVPDGAADLPQRRSLPPQVRERTTVQVLN
jgi:hypothetical protein